MTTIQESLQTSRWQARAEAEVAKLYPDTKQESWPGGRRVWVTQGMIDATSDLELVDRAPVMVGLRTQIEGLAVYYPKTLDLDVILGAFREQHPEMHKAFVQTAIDVIKKRAG